MRILNIEFKQILRIPYLIYIIRLTLKNLIVYFKIKSKNKKIIAE
jgi:hypothetical protein